MRTFSRRRGQDGFTLVELLVVIAILGILAGVVVFAVRGAGDKGKANAIATDERIVRTALEAYCANNGHYPPDPPGTQEDAMGVLVADRYLSSRSTYTLLSTGDALPEGICGEGGAIGPSHYQLESVDPTVPRPGCDLDLHLFCDVGTVPTFAVTTSRMLSLPSGKVLNFARDVLSVYDPAQGQYGTWSDVPYPTGNSGAVYRGRFRGTATFIRPDSRYDCTPNCNKVLAHLASDGWWIYDPEASSTPWTYAGDSQLDSRAHGDPQNPKPAAADQILGTDCDAYCGQFLMVYSISIGPPGTGFNAELWDPHTSTYSIVTTPIGPVPYEASVVALPDGRVLVTSYHAADWPIGDRSNPWTAFFDPKSYRMTSPGSGVVPGFNHKVQHYPYEPQTAVLDNGDVLFVDYDAGKAEIFQAKSSPDEDPWTIVPSCTSAVRPTEEHCRVLTAFAGGRGVLGVVIRGGNSGIAYDGETVSAWLFDRRANGGTGGWAPAETPARSTRLGAVIGGPSGTPHVGQIVTSGVEGAGPNLGAASQLYAPPASP